MVVAQWPEGRTKHAVTIDGVEVGTLEGETAGGGLLELLFDSPVFGRTIKITTIVSPSWVAWSEIEILAP